jgi:hypothetical protein
MLLSTETAGDAPDRPERLGMQSDVQQHTEPKAARPLDSGGRARVRDFARDCLQAHRQRSIEDDQSRVTTFGSRHRDRRTPE